MLSIGSFAARTCSGPTRRELLQVGATSFLGLSLPGWLRAAEQGAADPANDVSCILLFLWGGMPQLDTFDLKPRAPDSIRSTFNSISTQVPGIAFCEHLPRLASINKLITVVRSATHRETEHPRAAHFMMTGNQVIRGAEWPNLGASISRFTTARRTPLGAVVVGPRLYDMPITPTGQDGGFLGNSFAPFRVADPLAPVEKIASMLPRDPLPAQRVERRHRIWRRVNQHQASLQSEQTAILDRSYEQALALTTSPQTQQAFDLAREPAPLRDRYGRHPFGQGVLMARRLIDAGVRFVQVNWRAHPINEFGFDNHGDNFNRLKQVQLPQLDQTLSALLEDLVARGRLEKTVVLVTGEFGRTPKINGAAGRDHWPFCFSYLIAGAGIPGGRVIGASDQFAAYPAHDPVTPQQTVASIFSLVGLDLNHLAEAKVLESTDGIPGLLG
jgi:uncharacterized protein (DUF1501 family)